MQHPETTLTYEEDRIRIAIRGVQALLAKSDKPKIAEFYQTMEEVLIAIAQDQQESKTMRRAYDKMCRRVEIMEALLASMVKQ